jgi:hypothetical protein
MSHSDNVDFCYLALTGPHLDVKQTCLLPGLTFSDSTSPIELDDFWERQLGRIQIDSFKQSSLVIKSEQRRVAFEAPGSIVSQLEQKVRLFHYALVLGGCGYNYGALMVGGNTTNGHLHIGPISVGLDPCSRPGYREFRPISVDELKRASAVLVSLEYVYGHAPGTDYRRIRKGFNSWIQGAESADPAQRLHSFVRASEAIIRPTTTTRTERKITKTFLNRGQTFIGRSSKNERLLKQLYNLRSCIEHVKNVLPVVHKPRGMTQEEAFGFRALQAEMLASAIYSRIFVNDALREQFRTELRVEGFWRRSEGNRSRLWGSRYDLNKVTSKEFVPMTLPDIL